MQERIMSRAYYFEVRSWSLEIFETLKIQKIKHGRKDFRLMQKNLPRSPNLINHLFHINLHNDIKFISA